MYQVTFKFETQELKDLFMEFFDDREHAYFSEYILDELGLLDDENEEYVYFDRDGDEVNVVVDIR